MSGADVTPSCPAPVRRHAKVQLAHGGGGRLMRELIEELFLPRLASGRPSRRHDSAVVELGAERIAFTTDSYVVHPIFFPGGDIGSLSVFGTVNDLAMAGAEPRFLSAGFILEEGFPLDALERVAESMRAAADAAGVALITGDTKVVDRGKADGLFVNTAGIGLVPAGVDIAPDRVRPGDAVILSGDVGRHGIAILSVREGLEFAVPIESDCAPLSASVRALVRDGVELHCLRDLTRGGLASALNEIALDGAVGITIDEELVPVLEPVAGACELLGLDPLYVANEGRFVAIVPESDVERALRALRTEPVSQGAVIVGRVADRERGRVVATNRIGGTRLLDLLSGEQLPRIC